jgi:antitoxin (DNA-binding transcriptional repressor) of toxin-antitoxin stability system
MKALSVAEVKSHFSQLLSLVQNGEKIKILYGKSKKPIAMIVPLEEDKSDRIIGILDNKASFKIHGDGKITEKDFLGI